MDPQEEEKIGMSSVLKKDKPTLLNSLFDIYSYNGDKEKLAVSSALANYDIKNIMQAPSIEKHCSKEGSGFDLILEFTEGTFSLTHFVIRGASHCTSVIKDGLLWVSDSVPEVEKYTHEFDYYTKEDFDKKKGNKDHLPHLFFSTDLDSLFFQTNFVNNLRGKYIHIKFLNAHQSAGNNIDIGWIALVGFANRSDDWVGPLPRELDVAPPQFSMPVIRGDPLLVIDRQQFSLMHISNKEKRVYTSSLDGTIRAYDLETGEQIFLIPDCPHLFTLAVSDNYILGCGIDSIGCWDKRSGEHLAWFSCPQLQTHKSFCSAIDGNKFYTGHYDGSIARWDVKSGQCEKIYRGHTRPISRLIVEKDKMFSCSWDGYIRAWDLENEKSVRLNSSYRYAITDMRITSTRIYACLPDHRVVVLDRQSLEEVNIIPNSKELLEGDEFWNKMEYSNGKIYTGSIQTNSISVWDEETGELIQRLRGHNSSILDLSVSENRLYSISTDSFRVWDSEDRKGLHLIASQLGNITCSTASHEFLYVGCIDKTIKAINLWNGSVNISFQGHDDRITSLVVLDDRIFSGSKDETVRVWNRQSGECLQVFHLDAAVSCITIADEKLFIGCEDGTLSTWDVTGEDQLEKYKCNKTGKKPISVVVESHRVYSVWDDLVRYWNKEDNIQKVPPLTINPGQEPSMHLSTMNVSIREARVVPIVDKTFAEYTLRIRSTEEDNPDDYTIRRRFGEFWKLNKKLREKYSSIEKWPDFPDKSLYRPTEKSVQNSSGVLLAWLAFLLNSNEMKDDGDIRSFLSPSISSFAVTSKHLCLGFTDGSVRILDKENFEAKHILKTAHLREVTGMLTMKESYLYTCSDDETVKIFDIESGKCLNILRGHIAEINSLTVVEERLYSTSEDGTVRMWNLPLLMAPPETMSAWNMKWLKQYVEENEENVFYLLNIVCCVGTVEPAKLLIKEYNYSLNSPEGENKAEVSPLYYALSNRQWNFLRELRSILSKSQFSIGDRPSLNFVRRKAREDDRGFFQSLIQTGVHFPEIDVIARSFLPVRSELSVLRFWLQKHFVNQRNSNDKTLLHFAVLYGNLTATNILLNQPLIKLHVESNEKATPLHDSFDEDPNMLEEMRGLRSSHQLLMDRIECAKKLILFEDMNNKIDLLSPDADGNSVYKLVLKQYQYSREAMRGKSNIKMYYEPSRANELAAAKQRRQFFDKMCEIVDACNQQSNIDKYRRKFATRDFLKKMIPYLIWLILLLIVGFAQNSQNNSLSYYFTDSIRRTFVLEEYQSTPPKSFERMDTINEFWMWYDNILLPGLNQMEWHNPGEPSNDRGNEFLSGHRLIGNVRMVQYRVQNNSCEIPSQFGDTIRNCYSEYFAEDKTSYGPNDEYIWTENDDSDTFRGIYMEFFWSVYPKGGFRVDISPSTNTSEVSQELQRNNWIDSQTRAISITFFTYNVNLNLFGVSRFVAEFPASGKIVSYYFVRTVKAIRYLSTLDYFVLFLEIFLIAYFLLEFVFQEIYEWKKKGHKAYFSDYWNYYEWALIVLFFIIITLRFVSLGMVDNLDLAARNDQYVNLQPVGKVITAEQQIFALFVIICFLRALKFMRIPPEIGPASQAILDTVRARPFIVFMGMFLFVFFSFAVSFHLAFGVDFFELRSLENSLMTLTRMIFGDFVLYDELEASHSIMGPILFVLFLFVIPILVMNLFIAVVSETYTNVYRQNTEHWEQYITYLIVKDIFLTGGKSAAFDWIAAIYRSMRDACGGRILLRSRFGVRRRSTLEGDEVPLTTTLSETARDLEKLETEDDTQPEAKGEQIHKEEHVIQSYNQKELDALELENRYQRNHKTNEELNKDIQRLHDHVTGTLKHLKKEEQERYSHIQKEVNGLKSDIQNLHSDVGKLMEKLDLLLSTQKQWKKLFTQHQPV